VCESERSVVLFATYFPAKFHTFIPNETDDEALGLIGFHFEDRKFLFLYRKLLPFLSICLDLTVPRQKGYSEDQVIAKALNTFWRNGYAATSVRQLEVEMGINQFSIYSSFGSKKGVFIKALKQYHHQVKAIFLSELIQSNGHIEDIRKFFISFVDSVKSGKTPNGCLMANTAMDVGSRDKQVKVLLQLFFEMLKNVFVEVLEKAKKKNEIASTADIERYANYLVGCTEGLAVTAKVLDQDKLDDFINTTISALK